MMLCPSIRPSSTAEALKLLGELRNSSQIVEMRIDAIRDLDVPKLLSSPRPKVIITNRRTRDNGSFRGSDTDHLSILSEAVEHGTEYIDVEMQMGKILINKIRSLKKPVKIICSYHDFDKTPRNISAIYGKMKLINADIIKIATMGNSITDTERIFDLLRLARKERRKVIGICMGEYGELSRILGGKFGGYLSYVSPSDGSASGPGQITFEQMENVFHADKIKRSTKIFGLVGNPVKYSKGIYYHNTIFSRHSLDAVYVNILVDNLDKFLPPAWEYITGISVTMPFKKTIFRYLDRIDDSLKTLGIANTVIKRKGKLIGYNTDLSAILIILKKLEVGRHTKIMILGTGNMARTITLACHLLGSRALIVGRNLQKARDLADEYNFDFSLYDTIGDYQADILINGTSVGMGNSSERPPIPKAFLHKKMIVIDVVSSPPKTRLIVEAEKLDCRTITGIDIFSIQARLQSALFVDLCR
jgi:3-dehydroquinate dehydratase/shikimate dehydrogenase